MKTAASKLFLRAVPPAVAFVLGTQVRAEPGLGETAAERARATVPRPARCVKGDRPETGLQGQVPLALRDGNFGGFWCNLTLVSSLRAEGAQPSSGLFTDRRGRRCYYMSSSYNRDLKGNPIERKYPGVAVIDITRSARPVLVTSLTTKAMLNPWESLRVHPGRGLLVAVFGDGTTNFGSDIDIYDLSEDCRKPRLLASTPLGSSDHYSGHEGSFAPDGLTYYVGDPRNKKYHAVDIADPTRPRVIATLDTATLPLGSGPHGLSVSRDGNRIYPVAAGLNTKPLAAGDKTVDGFYVIDASEVQARKANPQFKLIGTGEVRDSSVAQVTVPMTIGGKPYMLFNGEGGAAFRYPAEGCAANLPPFPMARIFDMGDEKQPKLTARILLEINDPANCAQVLPDVANVISFSYGTHYCSVDNRENTTAVACGSINSGLRVFDVRNPYKPIEIAYYNPPNLKVPYRDPGSTLRTSQVDTCLTRVDFDFARRELISACTKTGMLVLKFAPGAWPLPESTPTTIQNQ